MGKVLLIDFEKQDERVFQEICAILKRRRAFFDGQEIRLTTKEFDLLCLLTAHAGCVFTYEQLYRNIWNQEPLGNQRNVVGCNIRSLRRKLCSVDKGEYIRIGCIREIGYCLEQIK